MNKIEERSTNEAPDNAYSPALVKIFIVYNVYINIKTDWRYIVSGQLYDLLKFGVLDVAQLDIVVTVPEGLGDEVRLFFDQFQSDRIRVHFYHENRYEYWGIKKIWDISIENPDAVLAYLHTKGMSYSAGGRDRREIILTNGTFMHWRRITSLFDDPLINKIGLFPSENMGSFNDPWGGWIWFNFWWARAEYVSKCVEPKFSEDRHYYESWLCRNQGGAWSNDCMSIFNFKNEYFSPRDASLLLDKYVY